MKNSKVSKPRSKNKKGPFQILERGGSALSGLRPR